MKWIDIEDKLPKELEKVLLTDLKVYWVGMYHVFEISEKEKIISWLACNPNEFERGHQPFSCPEPKYWCSILQPERSKREDLENKIVFREPDLDNMSPTLKNKYKLAQEALRCGALNIMET